MGVFLYTRHTWCIHTPHAHCRVITWVSSYTPDTHGVYCAGFAPCLGKKQQIQIL